MIKKNIPVRYLIPGDIMAGSGEIVIGISAGVRTPTGKAGKRWQTSVGNLGQIDYGVGDQEGN